MLNFPYGRSLSSAGIILIFTQSLTGCTGLASSNSKPVELVQGPPITDIFTPFDMALSCLKGQLRNDISFSVGAILDQTGKDVVTNGGSGKMVTQGAGDMVQSALFQSGVSVMNRRDPRIIESEAKWGIRDPRQIQASDYYVTGSINSLDFIPGGGLDMQIAGVGPNYSQTRIIVGLDLSLTDTRSSKVVANVSLQKQIAAQDYGISAGRFTGRTLLNIQIGKGEREATNFALRQMLNLATFELLSQVVPPPVFEKCRAEIPPEFGRLNLTRSSVALHKYKKNQQQNNLDSSIPVQELTSDDIQQSQEKNKSTNTPSKDTKAPKNKESEISKQDLIKYISKKHSPDSSDKMLEEKEKQEKNSKEKDEEKTSMLWDANPEVVENYWSSTLRD
jgi:curli biogenesis system outer membrane secretion channel CsgG